MQKLQTAVGRWTVLAALSLGVLSALACSRERDSSLIGTFRMGEKVQAGPVTYEVLESSWRTALSDGGRIPSDRFLFLRVIIANSAAEAVSVPGFSLVGPDQKTYREITENMQNVSKWLGLFRNLQPGQSLEGWVVFDAPMGAYKLVVSDAGDIGAEKYAHIDIPVHLE